MLEANDNIDLPLLFTFTKETSHYFEMMIDVIQLMIDNYQPPPTFLERTKTALSAIKLFPEKNAEEIIETVVNDTCREENPQPGNPAIRAIGKLDGKCRFIDIITNKIIE
jgi:hypothetical protein